MTQRFFVPLAAYFHYDGISLQVLVFVHHLSPFEIYFGYSGSHYSKH